MLEVECPICGKNMNGRVGELRESYSPTYCYNPDHPRSVSIYTEVDVSYHCPECGIEMKSKWSSRNPAFPEVIHKYYADLKEKSK